MISRFYTNKLVFGNKPQDIEGYTEAINSVEMYIPHHRLEINYTMRELQKMDRYDIVPPEELIWLPQSFHNGNKEIHKGLRENHGGNRKGHTPVLKPETVEKRKLRSLEAQIEKLNNERNKRLRKVRFELTINRTDISRQRKNQLIKEIPLRYERKKEKELSNEVAKFNKEYKRNLKKFEKLLSRQAELKIVGGKVWCSYEQKLQEMIKVL